MEGTSSTARCPRRLGRQSLLEVWRAAKVWGHQLTRPEQQKGGENQPLAAKRRARSNGGRASGAANGRASAKKRQTAPQLPCSLATGCMRCGDHMSCRWL